jgi:hypothetical protein
MSVRRSHATQTTMTCSAAGVSAIDRIMYVEVQFAREFNHQAMKA